MLVVCGTVFFDCTGVCVPSDLLDDVPDECGSLAQVSLHARDTRLRLTYGDLLYGQFQSAWCTSRQCAESSLFSSEAGVEWMW